MRPGNSIRPGVPCKTAGFRIELTTWQELTQIRSTFAFGRSGLTGHTGDTAITTATTHTRTTEGSAATIEPGIHLNTVFRAFFASGATTGSTTTSAT